MSVRFVLSRAPSGSVRVLDARLIASTSRVPSAPSPKRVIRSNQRPRPFNPERLVVQRIEVLSCTVYQLPVFVATISRFSSSRRPRENDRRRYERLVRDRDESRSQKFRVVRENDFATSTNHRLILYTSSLAAAKRVLASVPLAFAFRATRNGRRTTPVRIFESFGTVETRFRGYEDLRKKKIGEVARGTGRRRKFHGVATIVSVRDDNVCPTTSEQRHPNVESFSFDLMLTLHT